MTPTNTCALIIDIQQKLCPVFAQSTIFIQHNAKLLQGLTQLNIPLVVSEQYPKGLGHTVTEITALLPTETPFIEKTRFSAFLPEVEQFLQQHQTKNVILVGGETHICVLQTALDLLKKGYQVYIPQECVASRTDENKQNGLQQMQQAGAIISNIESLLFQLLADAKHSQFKAISQLIL